MTSNKQKRMWNHLKHNTAEKTTHTFSFCVIRCSPTRANILLHTWIISPRCVSSVGFVGPHLELWITPPISVDSGKGRRRKQTTLDGQTRKRRKECNTSKNRRQKDRDVKMFLVFTREEDRGVSHGEEAAAKLRRGNCESEQRAIQRSALCYHRGSEVFLILVYEVHSLDWAGLPAKNHNQSLCAQVNTQKNSFVVSGCVRNSLLHWWLSLASWFGHRNVFVCLKATGTFLCARARCQFEVICWPRGRIIYYIHYLKDRKYSLHFLIIVRWEWIRWGFSNEICCIW